MSDPYGPLRTFYARYAGEGDPARQMAWQATWDQSLRFAGLLAGLHEEAGRPCGRGGEAAEGRAGGRRTSLLDVGCGLGALAAHLPAGLSYTGIDLLPDRIAMAQALVGGDARFAVADVRGWRGGPYDYVVCSGALNVRVAGGRAAQVAWARGCVQAMWSRVAEGGALLFNCLLDTDPNADDDDEIEGDPFHELLYLPRDTVVSWCRALTPRIVLREDILPHELTAWCYRGPSPILESWSEGRPPHEAALAGLHGRMPEWALEVLRAAGEGPDSENLRAVAELQQGHPARAAARLDALLARTPGHAEAARNRAAAARALPGVPIRSVIGP